LEWVVTFDRSELIEALQNTVRYPEETPNSILRSELEAATGWGQAKALQALRAACSAGVVRPEMVVRRMLHGYYRRVPGYVLVSSEVSEG
jgi:hypothetical protein